jgi:phosphatidylglycerol:prolipoprotein diacylglycerol transferase
MVDRLASAHAPPPGAELSNRPRQRGGLCQVLFECRGLRIYSYPAMIYLGLTLGLVTGDYVSNFAGMNSARVFVAIVLLAIAGLIGARALFVASHWALYRSELARIWCRIEGGAAIQGGLALALVVSPAVLAALELPFGAFWDVATFVMLIWSIFGRIGCLLHGCCSGRPTAGAFALDLPDHRGIWRRRIPTQLLDAGFGVLLLIAVAALWTQRAFPGALFLFAVAAYGIARAVLQPLRAEHDRIGVLDIHQLLAIGGSVLALSVLIVLWMHHPHL